MKNYEIMLNGNILTITVYNLKGIW